MKKKRLNRVTPFSAHCISDQKVRTVVVRSVQKVYFWPLILGENSLVRSVQKLRFWPNSVVRNDQSFWPLLWSQNVVSNYNMTFRLRVEWKAFILAKGQNSHGQKCTKSAFLTTNFGRKFFLHNPFFSSFYTPKKIFSPPKKFFHPPKLFFAPHIFLTTFFRSSLFLFSGITSILPPPKSAARGGPPPSPPLAMPLLNYT